MENIRNLVTLSNGKVTTTSKVIAEVFSKNHKDVLRDIDSTILKTSSFFHERNFALMSYDVKIGNGAIRKDKIYNLTRDGAVMVIMSYTGEKAMRFKEDFINAFNLMESELENRNSPTVASQYITPNERTKIMRAVSSKAKSIMYANDLPFKKQFKTKYGSFTSDTNTKSCLLSEVRAAICGYYGITGYLRLQNIQKSEVYQIIEDFTPLFLYYDDPSLIGYSAQMNAQIRMLEMGMFTHPSIKMQPSLFDDERGTATIGTPTHHKVLQVPPPPTQSTVDLEALVKQINDAEKAVKALLAKAELQNA